MKKHALILTILTLSLSLLLAACAPKPAPSKVTEPEASTEAAAKEETTEATEDRSKETLEALPVIKVAATPNPHAVILEAAKPLLEKEGYLLEIIEYNDYVQPNLVVNDGEVDANYFQHTPYLDFFNEENKTKLVSIGTIHYELFALYPGKVDSIDALKKGSKIAVPNDGSNEARALYLLQDAGLITLKEGTGLTATILDIEDNPKELDIVELEAAQIPRSLPDVDLAVINGNYALEAGLRADKDGIFIEDAQSEFAKPYGNVLCVHEDRQKDPGLLALAKLLKSDAISAFIAEEYKGAVLSDQD